MKCDRISLSVHVLAYIIFNKSHISYISNEQKYKGTYGGHMCMFNRAVKFEYECVNVIRSFIFYCMYVVCTYCGVCVQVVLQEPGHADRAV